ncbi:MAG: acyl-CoA/acyl-ACP dehydrogenase [Sneathiella sp.]|nr:acyl-CoA/acyl-ACP dehydrogenase [Sneathiella sp.]
MNPAKNQSADILQLIRNFADDHIRPRRAELIVSDVFPEDLWQAFAASGLAGLSLPEDHGSLGANYKLLSAAARVISRTGGVPGVTMVFMAHWLMSKLHIATDAPSSLQRHLIPSLTAGKTTLSVAISEPGAGAHPKHLKTTARRDGNDFVLNGEKAFLTNGPLADQFIVLAITSETDGRKAFSAILVPADSPGFHRTEGVKIDFLHPCPHGGIALEDCRVPVANLLGEEGDAFTKTSMRMRAIEDAAGAAGQVGSMYCLLSDIAETAGNDLAMEIGAIATRLQALDVIAEHLASMADAAGNDLQPLLELQLGFHQQCQNCSEAFGALLEKLPDSDSPHINYLFRDISKSLSIAKNAHVARLAKIGTTVLHHARSR